MKRKNEKKIIISKGVDKNLLKNIKKITNVSYLGSAYGFESKTNNKIFTITSVNGFKEQNPKELNISEKRWEHLPDPRCWGWVPTLKEAEQAVKENAGDMAECCYYTHIVIEEVGAGIPAMMFSDDKKVWWYEWNVDPNDPNKFCGQWIKCNQPKWAEGICSWGI